MWMNRKWNIDEIFEKAHSSINLFKYGEKINPQADEYVQLTSVKRNCSPSLFILPAKVLWLNIVFFCSVDFVIVRNLEMRSKQATIQSINIANR